MVCWSNQQDNSPSFNILLWLKRCYYSVTWSRAKAMQFWWIVKGKFIVLSNYMAGLVTIFENLHSFFNEYHMIMMCILKMINYELIIFSIQNIFTWVKELGKDYTYCCYSKLILVIKSLYFSLYLGVWSSNSL